ncbi:MAG: hypothetical protein ACM3TR_13840 [Caulobacteraceae bacterium]
MDWYLLWETDAIDALTEFIASDLSVHSLKEFLSQVNLGTCAEIHGPISAAKLVLVYGNPDITLTSAEIEYLQYSETAIMCDSEKGFKIIALMIDCCQDDFLVVAAAMIKIFNLMFSSNNLFILKNGNKISIGCKRDFHDQVANNFCLTDLFGSQDIQAMVDIFGNDYNNVSDFVPDIIRNSSLEYSVSNYDKPRFDIDYIVSLSGIESAIGVNLTAEKSYYMQSFELVGTLHVTYKEISQALKYVAEPKEIISSYEALNAAEHAAEKAAKAHKMFIHNGISSQELPDITAGLSEAAFDNAEVMLNVLLDRDAISEPETDIDKILKENPRRNWS